MIDAGVGSKWRTLRVAMLARRASAIPQIIPSRISMERPVLLRPAIRVAVRSRGNGVEIQYPAGEVFREQRLERRGQSPLSRTGVHESQPESDLEDGNGSGPDGLRRLLIQPCNDIGIGLARHQRRQDVGVE